MDIGLDLQRAYDDGYKKGWEEAEAYALHCGDTDEPQTNGDRIRAMSDEELAEWFGKIQYDTAYYCAGEDKQRYPYPDGWLEWLKKEVEDEDNN